MLPHLLMDIPRPVMPLVGININALVTKDIHIYLYVTGICTVFVNQNSLKMCWNLVQSREWPLCGYVTARHVPCQELWLALLSASPLGMCFGATLLMPFSYTGKMTIITCVFVSACACVCVCWYIFWSTSEFSSKLLFLNLSLC